MSVESARSKVQSIQNDINAKHQIQLGLNYNLLNTFRLNWTVSARSGVAITPRISGDVNGDGYSNDRAFIFNPATATDPTVAAAMRSLLATGSGPAVDCLSSQLGKLAERNSCQGPWTSSANLSISFNAMKVHLPQRAQLSFAVSKTAP